MDLGTTQQQPLELAAAHPEACINTIKTVKNQLKLFLS